MPDVLWHLHRDDFHAAKNTVRGFLTHLDETIILQTVENLAARIPPGIYRCTRDVWYRGELPDVVTFEIQWPDDLDGDGVPDRDRILFHWANAVRNLGGQFQLLGCPAPGLERVDDTWETFYPGRELHDMARNLPGVASSQTAFERFMAASAGVDEFDLRVTEEIPPRRG